MRDGGAEPDAASVTHRAAPPRHHIGQFSAPQKRYFAPTPLAEQDPLYIVRWSGAATSVLPRHDAGMPFPSPTTGHALPGVGPPFVVTETIYFWAGLTKKKK